MKLFTNKLTKYQIKKFSTTTHEVFNQAALLRDFNLFESDPALKRGLEVFGGYSNDSSTFSMLNDYGKLCGKGSIMDIADTAERNKPILKQFDIQGNRVDTIDFNPAYHSLMKQGIEIGASAYGFNNHEKGSQVARAGLIYIENQLEPGHCCPIVMSHAAIPVLRRSEAFSEWNAKLHSQKYDARNVPIQEKAGITVGMSMTEKQGGSDIRANTTIAKPMHSTGEGNAYLLRGHKWFTSAPMSDGFLTLAKTSDMSPPSCFLVPRWLPDGTRNVGFKVMRLKDKLADRSNASSEVEYDDAWGMMIGEEGKGVKSIIEMVQCTRLDCTLGSAGGARRSLQHALIHASTRSAFGKLLSKQPLMENLLTDLCIEAEAHTLTALRMASAFERFERGGNEQEKELFRIGVSVSKYYVTKRLPNFSYECMEIFGGNGFVEDFPVARLFRQSPLNSIWEGSGNVMALDILRGLGSLPALMEEINTSKGMDGSLDIFVNILQKDILIMAKNPTDIQNQRCARNIVDRLALALQASIMVRYGDPNTAEGYISSRIQSNNGGIGYNYGSHVFKVSSAEEILFRNTPILK